MPTIGIIFLSTLGFFFFLSLLFSNVCSNFRKDNTKYILWMITLILFFINFICIFISPIKTTKEIDDYELLISENVIVFIYDNDKIKKFTEHKDYKDLVNSENKFKFYKESYKNIFGFYFISLTKIKYKIIN